MKEITKIEYHADDGVVFYSREACLAHELTSDRVAKIMKPFGAKVHLSSDQYIQHHLGYVYDVMRDLCLLANEQLPHKWFIQTANDPISTHPSWAGRLISEMDQKSLNSAWYRIQCIDKLGREWQPPYFANNTPENPIQVSPIKG